MNLKKKPQRYSYKKLLSTYRRVESKQQDQFPDRQLFINNNNNMNHSSQNAKSSSKNKSAQKILSVYESSRAKFKIGKFLNNSQRQYRVKTQNDDCQKTGSYNNKINSVRKLNHKEKQEKVSRQPVGMHGAVTVSGATSKTNTAAKLLLQDNRAETNKQRTFNKRLNLNSQLFQNLNNNTNSLEKSIAPQTSKHQKKNNFSFRKQHDSYRAVNKRTALEKYISESLENLECPVKKKVFLYKQFKNSRNLTKGNDQFTRLKGSKEKQHNIVGKNEQTHKQNKNHLLMYKGSKQAIKQNPLITDSYEPLIENNTGQIQQSRTIRGARNQVDGKLIRRQQPSRRIKTQADDSLQKIQIKWQKKRKNLYDLSNQQIQIFGQRFPDGFQKLSLLGRGGFSLVWLGEHKKSKKQYAVKQIITQSNHQTHKKQIWFGTYFFQFGGVAKQQFLHHPGIKNLVKLYYYIVNKKDTWLLYEKCGDSLGNALYQLKGEHYNGEKMYRIHYKEFYSVVRKNQQEIKRIVFQVARALQLLGENNIVHSDLKTQNILVKLRSPEQQGKTVDAKLSGRKFLYSNSVIQQVKLIDYGSSFQFSNLRQFSMATPQYMAPQILNFILYQNQLQYIPKLFQYVQQYNESWVIDIWSLGCVVLEIVSGIPLWMSLKTIVKRKGKELIKYGLFAVKGRTFDKIIKKQLEVVQNLEKYLTEQNYSDIVIDEELKYLLKKMLALNPAKRISPKEIMEFLTRKNSGDKD